MNSALGWLGDIAQWLGTFFPRLYNIPSTHGAIKFKHGRAVPIEAGMTIYWPITTNLVLIPVVRRTMQLAAQVISCEHGLPIAIVAVVIYRIKDVRAAVGDNYKIRGTIEDSAQCALFASASGKPIGVDLNELNREIEESCRDRLSQHGVEVETVQIIQWSRVLPLKRFGDWSHEASD